MYPIHQVNGRHAPPAAEYVYSGSDTLVPGMAVCFDTANATANNRWKRVAKPDMRNLEHFAGIVSDHVSGDGTDRRVRVVPAPYQGPGMDVYTNANIAAGDFLGVIPGSYALGKWVIGPPVLRATEAQDRSSTAGLVRGVFGSNVGRHSDVRKKRRRFVFRPGVDVSTTADAAAFLATVGTGSTVVVGDAVANSLVLNSATSGFQAQAALNGEPFSLGAGEAMMFRCKFKITASIAANTDFFIGLAITDTSYWSTLPTDYIGFGSVDGALDLRYVKDGTGGAVAAAIGTHAQDVFVEGVIIVDGHDRMYVFTDVAAAGTLAQFSHTPTAAEIPDDENLTLMADISSDAARTVTITDLEVVNHV